MRRLLNAVLVLSFTVAPAPLPEVKEAATHTVDVGKNGQDWARFEEIVKVPIIQQTEIEAQSETEDDFRVGVVSAYSLNVRDAPMGNVIGGLELQDEVVILDQSGDWVKIDYGETGWVHGDYLVENNVTVNASEQATSGDLYCPSGECWASVEFYYTPLPEHFIGNAAMYAPGLMEATAEYNGFDLEGFIGGVAVSSAADLGQAVWLRKSGEDWRGPYLVVDVSSRGHVWNHLVTKGQSVEIPFDLAVEWGMAWLNGAEWGINHGGMPDVEVYKGLLPPESGEPVVLRDWFLENGELDHSPSLSENRLWTIAMAEYQNFTDYLLDLGSVSP